MIFRILVQTAKVFESFFDVFWGFQQIFVTFFSQFFKTKHQILTIFVANFAET